MCYNTPIIETMREETTMKNAKTINNIADILLVLGALVYVYALLKMQTTLLTVIISIIFVLALVCKLAYRIMTREERKAAKEAAKGKAA